MGTGELEVMQEPILITGMARSGTSLIAGIIHYCGAWGGDMTGPTRNNKKGQFENNYLRDSVTKPALRAMGCDPLGQSKIPDTKTMLIDPNWRNRVLAAMHDQGLRDQLWMYKGAKMCLMWPQWNEAFPKAKWIIVRRDEASVIKSCLKTSFMRAYHNEAGWKKWCNQHILKFNEMLEAGLDISVVWSPRVMSGDFHEIRDAVEHVGLEWNEEKVRQFVTPEIWHGEVTK